MGDVGAKNETEPSHQELLVAEPSSVTLDLPTLDATILAKGVRRVGNYPVSIGLESASIVCAFYLLGSRSSFPFRCLPGHMDAGCLPVETAALHKRGLIRAQLVTDPKRQPEENGEEPNGTTVIGSRPTRRMRLRVPIIAERRSHWPRRLVHLEIFG